MRTLYVRTVGYARRASLDINTDSLSLILAAAQRELTRQSRAFRGPGPNLSRHLAGDVNDLQRELFQAEEAEFHRVINSAAAPSEPERFWVILADSQETGPRKLVTQEELDELNHRAAAASDGQWQWYRDTPRIPDVPVNYEDPFQDD